MIPQVTPAEDTGIIAGVGWSHLYALAAIDAVELALITSTFPFQIAFCPMASLNPAVISNSFIALVFEQQFYISDNHDYGEIQTYLNFSFNELFMDLKPALAKLEQTQDFKQWRKKNKKDYLSYGFKIFQEMGSDDWQLGFYNKKRDKITTFVLAGDNIKIRPEEEIFKKESMKVNEIELKKVRMTFDDALSAADKFQQKNFPKDKSIKTIAILQNAEKFGNMWNITYITEAFNTLNMKIDASSGKILEHSISSVFSFKKE